MKKSIILVFLLSIIGVFGLYLDLNAVEINDENNNGNYYTIKYHFDENSESDEQETMVEIGITTKTLTTDDLNFFCEGKVLKGWVVYRESDQSWCFTNGEDSVWSQSKPNGYDYKIYSNGCNSTYTGNIGDIVHFYGIWQDNIFNINYYCNEEDEASEKTTIVERGKDTTTLSVQELGFKKEGHIFIGWRIYRENDNTWYFTNGNSTCWSISQPADYEYALYENEQVVSKIGLPGTTVRFYAQWINSNINITDSFFGANGDDNIDDTKSIQKALNLGKNITDEIITINVPDGQYRISDCLKIYSNTNLVLSNNATINRCNDKVSMIMGVYNQHILSDEVGEYGKVENILISGGIWNGNIQNYDENGKGLYVNDLMCFSHGKNITIENLELKECCGNHYIELAAIKDSKVNNVKFFDYIKPTDNNIVSNTEEAIQLEYAAEENCSFSYPYDNTICSNIEIINCLFLGCVAGIGNHHTEYGTSDIIIFNNEFYNIETYCVNLPLTVDSVISENTAENIGNFCVSTQTTNLTISNNSVNNSTDNTIFISSGEANILNNSLYNNMGTSAIRAINNSNISINENDIQNSSNDGINCDFGRYSIFNNTVKNSKRFGIFIKGAVIEIENNTSLENEDYDISVIDDDYGNIASGSIRNNIVSNYGIYAVSTISVADNIVDDVVTNLENVSLKKAEVVDEGIEVTWNEVEGAQYYWVYRKYNGSGWQSPKQVEGTSYIDRNVEPGITYTYTVRAINGNVISPSWDKNGVSAVYSVITSLENVTLKKAEVVDEGIKVTWNEVVGARYYWVYRKYNGSGWHSPEQVEGTSYIDRNVEPGITYTYTVRAINGNVISPSWDKNGVSAVYGEVTSLENVTLKKAEGVGEGIKVTWNEVVGARYYWVYRKNNGSGWHSPEQVEGTSYIDRNVEPGITYTYTVRAINGNVISPSWDKNGVSAVYSEVTSLENVTLKKAEVVDEGIKVTWNEVVGAKYYWVYRKYNGSGWQAPEQVEGTSYIDRNVEPGITYTYTVRAINGNVISPSWDKNGVSAII